MLMSEKQARFSIELSAVIAWCCSSMTKAVGMILPVRPPAMGVSEQVGGTFGGTVGKPHHT